MRGRKVAAGFVENEGGPYEEQTAVLDVGRRLVRGICFARATDQTGETSDASRAVILR